MAVLAVKNHLVLEPRDLYYFSLLLKQSLETIITIRTYLMICTYASKIFDLLSSLDAIFTVALLIAPSVVTLLGSECSSIIILKISSFSYILSSINGMVNVALIIPSGNATLNGPDT